MDASMLNLDAMENDRTNFTVLQLITGMGVGGAERVVMELANNLDCSENIRSIVVVLNSNRREMLDQYTIRDFPIWEMGTKLNPWSFIRTLRDISRIIRAEAVDVAHAHMFHSMLMALFCKFLNPRLKIVFTSHSASGFSPLRELLIWGFRAFRDADVVFVKGQHSHMNASNTVVIPNGVHIEAQETSIQRSRLSRLVFLFVGRLEPVKNPIAIVRQFAAMTNKDCELWIAGDGELRSSLLSEIESLGQGERVRLLGLRSDLPVLLKQVDCFVMPSSWEGLPMALLEAGAAGLPAIATPVGAIPELLSEQCGYLFQVDEFHAAMDAVLNNYSDAKIRGNRLRRKIEKSYSLNHMCATHVQLYRSLVKNRAIGS